VSSFKFALALEELGHRVVPSAARPTVEPVESE